MITKSKRILSSVLAMILLITGLLPMSVSAADVTMDLSKAEVSWDYTLTDEEGNAFAAAYGLKAEDNPFGGAISPMLRRMHDYTAKRPGLTSDKSQWVYGEDYVYCFCIEHGVPLPDSGSYSASESRKRPPPSSASSMLVFVSNTRHLIGSEVVYVSSCAVHLPKYI